MRLPRPQELRGLPIKISPRAEVLKHELETLQVNLILEAITYSAFQSETNRMLPEVRASYERLREKITRWLNWEADNV